MEGEEWVAGGGGRSITTEAAALFGRRQLDKRTRGFVVPPFTARDLQRGRVECAAPGAPAAPAHSLLIMLVLNVRTVAPTLLSQSAMIGTPPKKNPKTLKCEVT